MQNFLFNPLTPNDPYMGRTAPLTSRRCILYIYSTNIGTEYFKRAAHSPPPPKCRLFHNATFFGPCIIHILNTECAKIQKEFPAPKPPVIEEGLCLVTVRMSKMSVICAFQEDGAR